MVAVATEAYRIPSDRVIEGYRLYCHTSISVVNEGRTLIRGYDAIVPKLGCDRRGWHRIQRTEAPRYRGIDIDIDGEGETRPTSRIRTDRPEQLQ